VSSIAHNGWQYEKLALQSFPNYHSSLIANFLYCVLSAAFLIKLLILKNINMKTNYREIQFGAGQSLETAIKELKKHKDLVCGSFHGQMLYSDVDDIDSAFKKVTGKTKAEFDAEREKEHLEYEKRKRKHKDAIPELTKEWIEKGNEILAEKYHENWSKCVPIRLSDLYEGMELKATLDIVKELNAGCELQTAKEIIEGQGHSGMSFGLVCSMVKSFCDRGSEFVSYARS
jgi:hypothetical protein